jgi:hypothetical protein
LYSYLSEPTAWPLGQYTHTTRISSTVAERTRFWSSVKLGMPATMSAGELRARIATPL